MNFGDKLKEERKKKGMSQKELGQKLGVSQAMIAQYEKGDRTPKIETINKIAQALDINPSILIRCNNNVSWIDLFSGNADVRNHILNEILEEVDITEDDLQNIIETTQEDTEKELLFNYRKLNDKGQEKAIEHVEMLTKIDEYKKKD